jgi:hypothetical protein
MPPAHWPDGMPASGTSSRIRNFFIREKALGRGLEIFLTSRPLGGWEVPEFFPSGSLFRILFFLCLKRKKLPSHARFAVRRDSALPQAPTAHAALTSEAAPAQLHAWRAAIRHDSRSSSVTGHDDEETITGRAFLLRKAFLGPPGWMAREQNPPRTGTHCLQSVFCWANTCWLALVLPLASRSSGSQLLFFLTKSIIPDRKYACMGTHTARVHILLLHGGAVQQPQGSLARRPPAILAARAGRQRRIRSALAAGRRQWPDNGSCAHSVAAGCLAHYLRSAPCRRKLSRPAPCVRRKRWPPAGLTRAAGNRDDDRSWRGRSGRQTCSSALIHGRIPRSSYAC